MPQFALAMLMLTGMPLEALLANGPPVRVTTDSSAYCHELCNRFEALPGESPEEARRLARRGKLLCETGHVRTGIAKLRRALRASHAAALSDAE